MKRDWLPLPYPEFMIQVMKTVGGLERFQEVLAEGFTTGGERMVAELRKEGVLKDGDRILDLGCGCGRLARALVDEPIGSYLGVDRDEAMVGWCREVFPPRDPRFSFEVMRSHPVPGADERFHVEAPLPDAAFDLVLAEVLFENMPLEHADAYLQQIARLLAPGGRAVAGIYFAIGQTYADPAHHYYEQKPFWRFVEDAGLDHKVRGVLQTGGVRNWVLFTSRKEL